MSVISKLQEDLWAVTALIVKHTHKVGHNNCKCYTCGAWIAIGTSNCHAGHCFSKKAYSGIKFHYDNLRPQCFDCNVNLNGNEEVFKKRLREELGEERYNDLLSERHSMYKLTRSELRELIQVRKQELKELAG